MEPIMGSLSGMLLLLAALLLWRGERLSRSTREPGKRDQLAELLQAVECIRRDCLAAIEHWQRRLETAQNGARAGAQERRGLAEPDQAGSSEKFQAAALLLGAGHAAEWAAAVLGLPVRQVELIKELQKITLPAHAGITQQAASSAKDSAKSRPRRGKKKVPCGEPGKTAGPILLTDVVRLDGAKSGNAEAA